MIGTEPTESKIVETVHPSHAPGSHGWRSFQGSYRMDMQCQPQQRRRCCRPKERFHQLRRGCNNRRKAECYVTADMSNALNLLSSYDSDAEDDEAHEKPIKLPLPDCLKENFPPPFEDEVIDDPEQHDGRSRRYPHQRGNWNSIVYIPYQREVPFDLLCDQIIDHCKPTVALKKIQDPHVSLTRTFVLLHHWIDGFVSSLKGSLSSFSRFDLQFDGLKVYTNEDNSRTFLALTVGFGKMEINKTVQILDKCLSEYKLHPFYDEGSFHMSIVWALGNKKAEMEAMVPELDKILDSSLNDNLDLTLPITHYICKIGHKIYTLKLL